MRLHWFVTFRSVFYALLLHAVAIALLFISLDFSPKTVRPVHNISIVNAVSVDKKQVEAELQRLKKAEQDKLEAEKKHLADLEAQAETEKRKAEQARKQRLEEEEKLLTARKKKEQEQQQRELEEKKLALLEKEKLELEQQRKIEEEKKQKAEEERKRVEEEKRRAEEERKRMEEQQKLRAEEERKKKEEEKLRAEEERRQKAAEEALQEQLAAEQAELQSQQDATLLQKIVAEIESKISGNFNKTGLPENLSGSFRVKLLPNGEVIDASVAKSSGNDIFDRRALLAIQKSTPLPVPADVETFERLKLRDISFKFTP